MLKTALFITFICGLFAVQQSVNNIRHQLMLAVNSSRMTDSLYTSLCNYRDKTPVILSYIGALQGLKAKYAWNPYFKFKYLNYSKKTFATAVTADPHNIEIRFMRFSVEHNVPGFLGDDKDLYADREEIIYQLKKNHFKTGDVELELSIISFLLHSKRCTPAENAYLTKQLTLIK